MQDQDAPPVEEGETGGGAVVVHAAELRAAVAVGPVETNSIPTSTPHPWITAIVRPWPATITARDCACVQVVRAKADTARAISSRFRLAKTPTPKSSLLLTTCSFKQRFRKPLASST